MAAGTVQEQRGLVPSPVRSGETAALPARQVGSERGAGARFFDKEVDGATPPAGNGPEYAAVWRCAAAITTITAARAFFGLNVRNTRTLRNRNWVSGPLSLESSEARRPWLPGRYRSKGGLVPSPVRNGEQQRSRAASRQRTRRGEPLEDRCRRRPAISGKRCWRGRTCTRRPKKRHAISATAARSCASMPAWRKICCGFGIACARGMEAGAVSGLRGL